jgi:branched-chain amino acid transport system permease protein
MERFFGLLVAGVVDGIILSGLAIAIVLIWRSARVLNLAQAVMAVSSVYFALSIYQLTGLVWLTLPAAIVAGMVFGFVVERAVVRYLDVKNHSSIIVTFGIMSIFFAVLGIVYGADYAPFPTFLSDVAISGSIPVSWNDILSAVILLLTLAAAVWVYRGTPLGLRMRAAAFNPTTARLLGVRVGLTLTVGWMIASAVGAVAGLLIVPNSFGLNPYSLDGVLLTAFVAAVIGGLESPVGAMMGSLILGITAAFTNTLIGTHWVPIINMVILFVVLLLRPQGIIALKGARRV